MGIGALYDMIAPKNKVLKPIGEFNSSGIIVNGSGISKLGGWILVILNEKSKTIISKIVICRHQI